MIWLHSLTLILVLQRTIAAACTLVMSRLVKKQHYSAVFINLYKDFDSVDHKVLILLKMH